MKYINFSSFITAAVFLSTLTSFMSQPVSAQSVNLRCDSNDDGNFATFIVEDGIATPLLAYDNLSSPEQICEDVTGRLNRAVSRISGDISSLLLRTGSIGSRDVICIVRRQNTSCNRNNVVMYVPSDRQEDPGQFLSELIRNAETFVVGSRDDQSRSVTYAKFGQALKRAIPSSRN